MPVDSKASQAQPQETMTSVKESTMTLVNDLKNMDTDALINHWLIPYGSKILLAIVIYVVGKFIAKMLSRIIGKMVLRSSQDEMLESFVRSITYFLALLVVVIAALSQLGINTSSLVALIGAAGLAIGLALQSSLQNFAAGVMLLIFKPFKKGHFVEVGGVSGKVEQMGILTLELRTPDNKTVLVPNGQVFSDSIINYSVNEQRRIDCIFDIAYDSDITQAKEIINKCIADDARILTEPAPTVVVGSLAASSVQLFVRPWVATADYWSVHTALMESVKLAFDEAGIEIPFNKLDINMNGPLAN